MDTPPETVEMQQIKLALLLSEGLKLDYYFPPVSLSLAELQLSRVRWYRPYGRMLILDARCVVALKKSLGLEGLPNPQDRIQNDVGICKEILKDILFLLMSASI